jgi:hypothetical protein
MDLEALGGLASRVLDSAHDALKNTTDILRFIWGPGDEIRFSGLVLFFLARYSHPCKQRDDSIHSLVSITTKFEDFLVHLLKTFTTPQWKRIA